MLVLAMEFSRSCAGGRPSRLRQGRRGDAPPQGRGAQGRLSLPQNGTETDGVPKGLAPSGRKAASGQTARHGVFAMPVINWESPDSAGGNRCWPGSATP